VKTYQSIIRGVTISFSLGLALCATSRAQENALPADIHPSVDVATPAPSLFDLSAPGAAQTTTTTKVAATPPPTVSDDIADGKWHMRDTVYLWVPSIHGITGIGGYNTGMHITGWDLVKNLTFAIQDQFEPQYKRISIPMDFIWIRLNDSVPLPVYATPAGATTGSYTANVKATIAVFTPKLAVLVVNQPAFKLYGTGGLRYWHLGLTESLTPPLTSGPSPYQAANWVDFALGARGTLALSRKASFTVAGDAGKGGANVDYQVVGLLGYQLKKAVLQAGWRYLDMHYNAGARQVIFYPEMSGVILGVTFRIR
jgi:hypothetical protein